MKNKTNTTPKIFIDGAEGTTGLKIRERLAGRNDIEILEIASDRRKDLSERKRLINASDVTFLCLPDSAARESASLVENDNTVIIDASTAHRTDLTWSYGFPELSPCHRKQIQIGKRIAVPGCHATGFIALIYPLVKAEILPRDYPLSVSSLSGYSGAGKSGIEAYEAAGREDFYDAPRPYAIGQRHKHLPEMTQVCGLDQEPHFSPIIADYYQGMLVYAPLHSQLLARKFLPGEIADFYRGYYREAKLIRVKEVAESEFLAANALAGKDSLEIYVQGNEERFTLYARFDNLGKGASGAAVQCLNIATGKDETAGLLL